MSKSTILRPADAGRVGLVPRDSALVVEIGADPVDAAAIASLKRGGHVLAALLVDVPSLDDPRLPGLLEREDHVILRHRGEPSVAEALARARDLARPHVTLELPLETEEHLTALKIVSSLGVRARIDIRCLRSGSDVVTDALYDAMVRPGRRAPVSPFDDLERGFDDEDFEIARLDHAENDHHVDLRGGRTAEPTAWRDVDVWAKRIPFLLERHHCAFCEGLAFCNGYLYDPATAGNCRRLFGEFAILHDLAVARRLSEPQRPGEAANPEARRC